MFPPVNIEMKVEHTRSFETPVFPLYGDVARNLRQVACDPRFASRNFDDVRWKDVQVLHLGENRGQRD